MLDLLRAAADLVLPAVCAGCGASGAPVCGDCASVVHGRPRRVVPFPVPPAWPTCWAGGDYESVAAGLLREYKDGDRRDLRPLLADLLGSALDALLVDRPGLAATAASEGVLVVCVPSSGTARRRRGDHPVRDLAAAALTGLDRSEACLLDGLRLGRSVVDQSTLGMRDRHANLGGAMTVLPSARALVRGASCVVVDDVVTSGSTIAEAARVLRWAGADQVAAATALATPLRRPVDQRSTGSPHAPMPGE